jgi:hypothetical protein
MEKKYSLILDDEFILFCKINNINDVDKLAKETFNKGFNLLKYGEEPKGFLKSREKVAEEREKINVLYESTNIPPEIPIKLVSIGKERDLYGE